METRTVKVNNDLTVRIPHDFARELDLGPDSTVELSIRGGSIIICPSGMPRSSLDELLAGVTEDNRHGEVDTGPAVGRELW